MKLVCVAAAAMLVATAAAAQGPAAPPPPASAAAPKGAPVKTPAPAAPKARVNSYAECHALARQRRLRGAERRRFTARCQTEPAAAPKG